MGDWLHLAAHVVTAMSESLLATASTVVMSKNYLKADALQLDRKSLFKLTCRPEA